MNHFDEKVVTMTYNFSFFLLHHFTMLMQFYLCCFTYDVRIYFFLIDYISDIISLCKL